MGKKSSKTHYYVLINQVLGPYEKMFVLTFNPIQAGYFAVYMSRVFRDLPLMISGAIKTSPMKLCTVI